MFNTSFKKPSPIRLLFIMAMLCGYSALAHAELVQGPYWSRELEAENGIIRVKIFPHNSIYTTPAGPESAQDNIQMISQGNCTSYAALSNSSVDGYDSSKPISQSSRFHFTLADLQTPLWLMCDKPTSLVRSGATSILYTGAFFLKRIDSSGQRSSYITVVNVLPLDDYLKGVVPSEMPSSWPQEALKAQAIAARTFTLYEISTNVAAQDSRLPAEDSGAQIDDTVFYQAYLGMNKQVAATDSAVSDTSGQAITYNGNLICAYFHSMSGGRTEDAANYFGFSSPALVGVADPASIVPGSEWDSTKNMQDLETALKANNIISSFAQVTGMKVDASDILSSGRVGFVSVNLNDGNVVKVIGKDFAHYAALRSNWFSFTSISGNTIHIHGRGYGHGVGMSQWGANMLAQKQGKSFDQILSFYYSGTSLGLAQ